MISTLKFEIDLGTLHKRIQEYLHKRADEKRYRRLTTDWGAIDLSSNDYLGFSRSSFIAQEVENDLKNYKSLNSGATGSRLLNGNSVLCEELENLLAATHHAEAALLFNSGFDANVGLISTVARPRDIIFYDELIHASILQGMKLCGATLVAYEHNNPADLEEKLNLNPCSNIGFIITESIFSMEGDRAKLSEIAKLATSFKLELIVDEAHATGLFGRNGSGYCNEAGVEDKCFARVYTFGKAIGSHGAVVVGSQSLKEYLINFSKNFIYTTALETANLVRVKHSYIYIQNSINQLVKLNNLNKYLVKCAERLKNTYKLCGEGPIFGIIVPDPEKCRNIATHLQNHNLDVKPILSPTVPKGTERLRVILHSYNTTEQIDQLIQLIIDYQEIDRI